MTAILTDDDLFEAAPADDVSDLLTDAPVPADRFAVVDESSAAWVVNKMLTHDEQIARLKAQYKEIICSCPEGPCSSPSDARASAGPWSS